MTRWPSAELKAPAPGKGRITAAMWWLLLAIAVVAILGGIWRSIYEYRHPTGFDRVGLTLGAMPQCVRVIPESHLARAVWPRTISNVHGGCIVGVGDADVDLSADRSTVGKLLDGPPKSQVKVLLVHESGVTAEARFRRVETSGWYDAILIAFDSLVAALYAAAALLLRLRRPQDPVARRMSLAFVMIAHVCNGPIAFWTWTGVPLSLLALIGFLLMTVTLPAYPDGTYVPRATRWVRVVVPGATIAAIILAGATGQSTDWFMKAMLGVLIVGVALLILRYRRMPPGLQKQQVKWAVFGLSIGWLLVAITAQLPKPAGLAVANPDLFERYTAVTGVLNLVGYALIPAGILISLLQYRLNDADAAAGKSLGYAAVTLIVGIVWAVVQSVVGNFAKTWFPDPLATTAITTAIAALVFTPARTHVLAWTEQKFQPALVRLRKLPEKLLRWQTCHAPEELAQAALADLVSGVGAAYAAILGDDGREWRVLGAHGIEPEKAAALLAAERPPDRGADPFPIRRELADQLGQPDLLAIGPRSDGASYSGDEKAAIALIIEPLSNALEAAALRERHVLKMEGSLAGIDQRLARLEGELAPLADEARRRSPKG